MILRCLEQALAARLLRAGWLEWEVEVVINSIFHPLRDDVS